MLCDVCKTNPASVRIVKIIDGFKQQLNICESCAKSSGKLLLPNNINGVSPFNMNNVLGGLVDHINKSSGNLRTMETACPRCGITYSEFKEKGILGCSNCYTHFSKGIMPIIKRIQRSSEHVGKIPLRSGNKIIGRKKILELKEELQKAILAEEYERAAVIRDEIRQMQGTDKEG